MIGHRLPRDTAVRTGTSPRPSKRGYSGRHFDATKETSRKPVVPPHAFEAILSRSLPLNDGFVRRAGSSGTGIPYLLPLENLSLNLWPFGSAASRFLIGLCDYWAFACRSWRPRAASGLNGDEIVISFAKMSLSKSIYCMISHLKQAVSTASSQLNSRSVANPRCFYGSVWTHDASCLMGSPMTLGHCHVHL